MIVEAFNPTASAFQNNILEAAVRAGVKHVITPDFSSDTFNPYVGELEIFGPKLKAQKLLEALSVERKITWTAIIVGPFYDWAIPKGLFWINTKDKKITVFGSGNQRFSMSPISLVGQATVHVLQHQEQFINRPAYFARYTISTNELANIVREVAVPGDWQTVAIPLTTFFENGRKLWEEDTKNGVIDRLNTTAYAMLGTYGIFEEGNKYGADFEDKIEPGWSMSKEDLRIEIKKLLRQ